MMGKAPTVHERSVSEDHWAVVPEGEGLFSGDAGRRVDMVQLLWQTRPLGRETVPEAQCGRHDVGMIGRMSNEVYGAKKEKSYASSITDRISSCQKENIASSGLRAHMSRSGRGVAKSREPIWPRGRARLRTPERQILWAKIDFLLGHLSELNRKATIRWPTAGDALAAKTRRPRCPLSRRLELAPYTRADLELLPTIRNYCREMPRNMCGKIGYNEHVWGICKVFMAVISFRLSLHLPFSHPIRDRI